MRRQDWPLHGTWPFLIHAIVVHVPNNADYLPPLVLRVGADLFAKGTRGIVPVFSRQFFGDDGHRNLIVDIAPGEVAAGDERRTEGLEKARCDEPEAVERNFTRGVS